MYLAKIMHNPLPPQCYMNECSVSWLYKIKELLIKKLNEKLIVTSLTESDTMFPSLTMETILKNIDYSIKDILGMLLKMKTHSFIAN